MASTGGKPQREMSKTTQTCKPPPPRTTNCRTLNWDLWAALTLQKKRNREMSQKPQACSPPPQALPREAPRRGQSECPCLGQGLSERKPRGCRADWDHRKGWTRRAAGPIDPLPIESRGTRRCELTSKVETEILYCAHIWSFRKNCAGNLGCFSQHSRPFIISTEGGTGTGGWVSS